MGEKTIFTWTEELSVGDAMIDSQHESIFDATNRLFDIATGDRAPEEIFGVLTAVERYIREHFSYEEAYMERHGYPMFSEHRRIHERFVADFAKRKQELTHKGTSSEAVLALENYLGTWLIRHVSDEDQKYAAFIREHPEVAMKEKKS
jgi:hemerythrin